MLYPIYVPSKGRPKGKSFAWLKELECQKFLLIEPTDMKDYAYHVADFDMLYTFENNLGIAYARSLIKLHAESQGFEYYWSIDDDISSFHECQTDGKLAQVSAQQALEDAQNLIVGLKVAQGAINYAQFAFGKGKIFSFNKRCLIATLNHVDSLKPFEYDLNCTLKEDIDFTMQILTSGKKTVLCNKIGFKVPVYGSSKGGCYEFYQKDRIEKTMSQYLEKKWGSDLIKTVLKDNGRYDVKINWAKFKS